jgi:hypothetical protein
MNKPACLTFNWMVSQLIVIHYCTKENLSAVITTEIANGTATGAMSGGNIYRKIS